MRIPYYEVYLMQGMCSQTLKKCKRRDAAIRFAEAYAQKHGVKPHILEVVAEVNSFKEFDDIIKIYSKRK